MEIFSFFKFYYYVIRRSPKQYDMAMEPKSFAAIIITPVVLFSLSLILGIFISSKAIMLSFVWVPIFVGNIVFSTLMSDEGHMLKWKRESDRIQARREELERELERKRRERYREYVKWRVAQEEKYREFYDDLHGWQREQQRYAVNADRNMKNAMHLLGLNEGFTKKDVKVAYRKMSKIHHPDVGGLEENFKKLNTAYKYIMDRI